ncbi:CBS domain-containing protein [Pseudonocardia acaciae]|uniref:CBS domain-containing protein n=1 Tax=Pseudonocardia acaciae TaxID=551276 RepID=UPI000687486F|nr:CBS domain-containing protein [Pseudonocardia acaciae]
MTVRVGDVMTAPVLTTTPRTEAADAALVIGLREITALPVLDDGRLVGMFTEADLLRCQRAAGRSDLLVEDVMVPVALVTTPGCDPAELAQVMRRRQVWTVPVLENGRLVGIITGNDLRARSDHPRVGTNRIAFGQ